MRGLRARPLQLQREGRPLRGVRGRRAGEDRDALPPRRVRPLRPLPGEALQPRDARGPLQGTVDRRRARDDRRGGAGVLRRRPARPLAGCRRSRTWGSATSGSVSPPTTLSGGEAQRVKLATELSKRHTGQHALHPRRAHHRAPLRGHPDPARRPPPAGRARQHGDRHRAPPRRREDRRLGDRPRPRGRRRGRRDRRSGTPEELAANPLSHTGRFLADVLGMAPVG